MGTRLWVHSLTCTSTPLVLPPHQGPRALVTAYRCLTALVRALEGEAAESSKIAAAAAAAEEEGGGMGEDDGGSDRAAAAAAAAAAEVRVGVMCQHLRAFARRFREQSSEVAAEVASVLEEGGGAPERVVDAVRSALSLDLDNLV